MTDSGASVGENGADCSGLNEVDCRCLVKDLEPPLTVGDLVMFEGQRCEVLGFRAHGRLLDLKRPRMEQVLCVPRAPFGVPLTNAGDS